MITKIMQIINFAAAEKSVRSREGMAEGGCGGNSAMPERIELSPRHLPEYLEGRTPKKNVLSFLEEIGRAQIRKARNIFSFWGCRVKRGGGGAFVERTLLVRATTRSARAISRDCFQNKFEFCTIDTARNRNRILEPKWGRAEGATLMHSPRRIRNPKGFSTLRVAPRLPIQNKKW